MAGSRPFQRTALMWRTEEHALSQEPQSPLHFVMSKQGVGADKCCFSPYLSPRLRGFPAGSNGEESACSAGNMGSIPGLGRSPGEGHGNPLQCSCLENPMDRGPHTVHGITKSQTGLSDYGFLSPELGGSFFLPKCRHRGILGNLGPQPWLCCLCRK